LARNDFEDKRQNYLFDVEYREHIIDLLGEQEIGLHGSPESAFDPAVLKEELDNLRAVGFNPTGYRTHYLHFDYQKSFTILEEAGIQYDSTLGYWENIGFRAGISFPFFPFNIKENRPFRVLEIPLIVMDTTLYSQKAMNLSKPNAQRSIRRLIDLAAKYQSHLSLLWHNNTFDPIDYPGWGQLYYNTIDYAVKKQGWVTSLHNIHEEWVNLSY
jgi:peptidoglycan/xylan/chitin deacetylase (PgdA/CDA1 family)